MRHLLDDFEMPDLFPHDWFVASTLDVKPGKPVKPGKLVNCRHVSIFTKVSTYEP